MQIYLHNFVNVFRVHGLRKPRLVIPETSCYEEVQFERVSGFFLFFLRKERGFIRSPFCLHVPGFQNILFGLFFAVRVHNSFALFNFLQFVISIWRTILYVIGRQQ